MTHEEQPSDDVAQGSKKQRLFMAIFGAAFALVALAPNVGVTLKGVALLRLGNKWDMFARPSSGDVVVALGVPRPGSAHTEPLVLADPSRRDPSVLARLRDARQRKLFEFVGKPPEISRIMGGMLQQSYVDYLCRTHGAEVSEVRLVLLPRAAQKEPRTLVSRACRSPS